MSFRSGNQGHRASVVCVGLLCGAAWADEIHWASGVSGNWSDGTKWVGGAAPGASDTAVIDPAGTYTVTLNVDATVAGMTLGGSSGTLTLSMTGKTLTLNGSSIIGEHGRINLINGSTIDGTALLENHGSIILSGSIVSTNVINVDLNNGGLLQVDSQNGTNAIMNGALSNTGTVHLGTHDDQAQLTVANGFTNDGLIELGGGLFGAHLTVTSGVLVNNNTIHILSGGFSGSRVLTASVQNLGTIDVDQTATINDSVGPFDTTLGELDVASTITLSINAPETRFGTATTLLGSGTVTLGGTHLLTLVSDFTHQPGGTGSRLDIASGAVTVNGPGMLTNQGTLVLEVTHVLGQWFPEVINANLNNMGLLQVNSLNAGGHFINGAFLNSGTLHLGTNDDLAELTVANGFTNDGLIELGGGLFGAHLAVTSGVLVNNNNIHILSGGFSGSRVLSASVQNLGTIDVDQTATINPGALGIVHSGSIDIAASLTLMINGGSFEMQSGTMMGDGVLNLINVNFFGVGDALVRVSGNSGTVITASGGNLGIGKSSATDGFSTSGAIHIGLATLTLHDSNTPTIGGAVTLGGGTLVVPNGYTHTSTMSGFGTVQANTVNNGTITVGASPGILNIVGNYTQGASGILNIELGGLVLGTEYDRLAQSGLVTSATLGGTLNIARIGSYVPLAGNVFTILTSNARVGTFATVNGLNMPCTTTLAITYHPTEVRLTASGGCNDTNACTTNVCDGGPGTCTFPANYDTVMDCCSPSNGALTAIDDDNVCTQDSCNASNGVVTHTDLTPPGFCCSPLTGQFTFIDDKDPCTIDACNADGSVDHDPLPDTDSDSRCDAFDNCPAEANPLQEDCDADGVGDACQYCGPCQLYGDIVDVASQPNPDCTIDVSDLLCVLDAFVDPGLCLGNADIIAADFSCMPDDIIDSSDILCLLDSFEGTPCCPPPCPVGGCIADWDGNPNTPLQCRDDLSTQLGGGLSEQDCCRATGNTGFYCGDSIRCGTPGCP